MFSPFKVSAFQEKILSLYTAGVPLNAGALVDLDPTVTVAVGSNASVGFDVLTMGSLKLATVLAANAAGSAASNVFGKELGLSIPAVNATGPTLVERILELASSYMTIPVGAACAVLKVAPGDIVATTEFVGYLPTDSSVTGNLSITTAANLGCAMGVAAGRYRIAQSGDAVRARYVGNTQVNGTVVGLFEVA